MICAKHILKYLSSVGSTNRVNWKSGPPKRIAKFKAIENLSGKAMLCVPHPDLAQSLNPKVALSVKSRHKKPVLALPCCGQPVPQMTSGWASLKCDLTATNIFPPGWRTLRQHNHEFECPSYKYGFVLFTRHSVRLLLVLTPILALTWCHWHFASRDASREGRGARPTRN